MKIRIQDTLGMWWQYCPDRGQIFCEEADADIGPEHNGYWVDSAEEGLQFLIDQYYLEPFDIATFLRFAAIEVDMLSTS